VAGTRAAGNASTSFGAAELAALRQGDPLVRARLWEAIDAALRRRILPEPGRVRSNFRPILPDPFTAEEFISDWGAELVDGVASGRIASGFDERQGDLVDYLCDAAMLRKKAIRWRARRPLDEQALDGGGEPSGDALTRLARTEPGRPHDGVAAERIARLLDRPLEPDLRQVGGPAQRRFACLQFWPRLDEEFRQAWAGSLAEGLAAGVGLAEVDAEHAAARRRLAAAIERHLADLARDRGPHPRRRRQLEAAVIGLRAEAILHPLDAAAVRRLLGTSEANAHQLKRRLVLSAESILPGLALLLGEVAS